MGESAGSTPTICTSGLCSLSTCPTPVIVPPVPMPDTKMSTPPSVSSQTSSAVVARWISTLASFSNCFASTAPGGVRGDLLARATAPFMPSAPGVSTSSAP